ncbi:WD40-repeat-containing domain protein [Mucor lusitanicus]|uniref:WD40-repeat-containing domain protein n=1 Tax=Mucor circinelloides f. lusitanicus TaxID=29924 RepID=A0A8H4BH33_MUCCL|nr:WD40-repeat-containing domain protein [Mucor lusitanicus]
MSSDGNEEENDRVDNQHNRWPSLISSLLNSSSRSQNDKPADEATAADKIDEELLCPICQDLMREVYATHCGHSFCHECLTLHLENASDCPLCRAPLSRTNIYPNFQLNKLASFRIRSIKEKQSVNQHLNPIEKLIIESNKSNESIAKTLANSLSYHDLISVFETAITQRKQMEQDESKIKKELLKAFLERLEQKNKDTVRRLETENTSILADLKSIDEEHTSTPTRKRKISQLLNSEDGSVNRDDIRYRGEGGSNSDTLNQDISENQVKVEPQQIKVHNEEEEQLPVQRRLNERFNDLRTIYHRLLSPNDYINKRRKILDDFSTSIYELTRYDQFEEVDTIDYTDSTRQGSSIVSTIGFDRDQEFFAVGGVSKEIKVFDFNMMGYARTGHCPLRVLACSNKISCLSWSPYVKSQLASSDYEGLIDIWDSASGRKVTTFTEHKKRAWSVNYCETNPTMLASGSDDSTVKIWSLSHNKAIHTLEQKGNVCCAKFAPNSSYYLAVGSADHHISCYDLRFPNQPMCQYIGHKKAVSYVKWLSDRDIVSASTDSTLKLWDRESRKCLRSFEGHQNEKNFVGLSTDGDWISCGSECNTVFTYHKNATKPIATYTFPSNDCEDENIFVSSVCWKKDTKKLVAANSKGMIKVLSLK